MIVLFISKHKYPHIGGVERHLEAIRHKLNALRYKTKTISEEDINPPHIKIIGLLYIWFWFFKNIKLFLSSDIIHIHDVFIWVLPIRLLLFWKKFYITFHGWEGKYPIPIWNILNKKIAYYLSNGSVAVGNYINKWYGIKTDYIVHGATSLRQGYGRQGKLKNSIVWLGRQDRDTGIEEFKKWLVKNPKFEVTYVTNVKNPEKYLEAAEYCVPSGYLSYLESLKLGCKILTFPNNPLKVDYWKEVKLLKNIPTWEDVTNIYLKIWKA